MHNAVYLSITKRALRLKMGGFNKKNKKDTLKPVLFIPKDKKDRKPFVVMSSDDLKKTRINAYPYVTL